MDPDLAARAQLLRTLTAQLDKDSGISAPASSAIATTIAQHQLLRDALAASPAAAGLSAEIDKFTASVQRLHSKGKGDAKAAAAALLRTCIAQASHARLVSEFQAWGQQLLDAIKKDTNAGNDAAAREACAALAELVNRCGPAVLVIPPPPTPTPIPKSTSPPWPPARPRNGVQTAPVAFTRAGSATWSSLGACGARWRAWSPGRCPRSTRCWRQTPRQTSRPRWPCWAPC
jgi:hypothetical protein